MQGKILIIFGSKSDNSIYNDIKQALKGLDVDYEMRICSAHRTPDELELILNTDADVIIAGAGLAAHLPGVVASKTIRPIIGVPVSGNYQGMDAMLSIMQMPPGIPVMSTGVDLGRVAAIMASKMLNDYKKVVLVGDEQEKAVQKAIDILKELDVNYEIKEEIAAGELNIKFVTLDEAAADTDELIIYVPLLAKDDDSAEAALNVLENSSNGLWVGLNRGDNAALAAIEIMNLLGKYTKKLNTYRRKHAEKVIESDKEEIAKKEPHKKKKHKQKPKEEKKMSKAEIEEEKKKYSQETKEERKEEETAQEKEESKPEEEAVPEDEEKYKPEGKEEAAPKEENILPKEESEVEQQESESTKDITPEEETPKEEEKYKPHDEKIEEEPEEIEKIPDKEEEKMEEPPDKEEAPEEKKMEEPKEKAQEETSPEESTDEESEQLKEMEEILNKKKESDEDDNLKKELDDKLKRIADKNKDEEENDK